MTDKILEVKDLEVSFLTYAGEVKAIRGVTFDVKKGEAVAIVGESGSGKSVTSQSIMQLIPSPPGVYKNGEIIFDGQDLLNLNNSEMEKVRGSSIGMIFQDPMTSLNPTMTVGKQIAEGLIKHQGLNKSEAMERAVEMLRLVGIPNPEARVKQYPHEFSGGMRQRAMIAIALSCNPKLLIADEPTTALDVTIQAQIIDLMKDLQNKFGTSIIIITHDLGVVADLAQRVVVMYAGKIIEQGSLDDIFYNPQHPYTWGLLRSVPRLDSKGQRLESIEGTPPDLLDPPKGCPFYPRCDYAMEVCVNHFPEETKITDDHKVHCWLQHPDAPKVDVPIKIGGANNEAK
ncbi:peptide ABC transporter ATP-binding protein [Vulcanibacillus modesticaldus]|uniref:Peptide ABC transporter ATP-binding protein n=1 Tax=Vulcanibacillus modesticaldus TaxID=337097 RepID=A0A1D2YWP4_9BACI|nr:ABC transporter ATP-binding protein [Vulcanibacillus modesticaldus]OEG00088.1 peptide ABC transporter ATP-binding protein [Vulcanibacillus modesticaldus]